MPPSDNSALARWLDWLETLHPSEIELGLDRVGAVASALGASRPAPYTVTVGGTNGKGSVVAHLEGLLSAHGHSVGAYTSPHLHHFGERIRIGGRVAADAAIVEAFERVDQARGKTQLTFFEFTTLAAFEVFRAAGVDYALLEVGLGGRLDATNVIDADVAAVTSIGLDHSEWLGPDRDTIGAEKGGIARAARPFVVGERATPAGLLETAAAADARVEHIGEAFDWGEEADGWRFHHGAHVVTGLPWPALPGRHAVDNAAVALAILGHLPQPLDPATVRAGLARVEIPGRFDVRAGRPETILDVAHNPQAAEGLARALLARGGARRTHLVLAGYHDKDLAGIAHALAPGVDTWFPAHLPPPRGASGPTVADLCCETGRGVAEPAADPGQALAAALGHADPDDRVVVAGSFASVSAAQRWLATRAGEAS